MQEIGRNKWTSLSSDAVYSFVQCTTSKLFTVNRRTRNYNQQILSLYKLILFNYGVEILHDKLQLFVEELYIKINLLVQENSCHIIMM